MNDNVSLPGLQNEYENRNYSVADDDNDEVEDAGLWLLHILKACSVLVWRCKMHVFSLDKCSIFGHAVGGAISYHFQITILQIYYIFEITYV